jgi:type IV pilus assembly protein PilX
MMPPTESRRRAQQGIVLVSSLLLLVVITIIAISMFRSFGLQERIAGNMREKHRAVQAAESAEQFAEYWITQGSNANNTAVCAVGILNANAGLGQICTNQLTAFLPPAGVTSVPWPVGVDYTPAGMIVNQAAGAGNYFAPPRFYVSLLGAAASGQGLVYQIDAYGYGGTTDAVAVVESTYLVSTAVQCPSCGQ